MKTHQNATTNLPFVLSPKMLCCLELVEEDVLCCSAKVCKLAEIQGGDCGDDRKSHRSRVHVKNICAIKLGAAICITHWAIMMHSLSLSLISNFLYSESNSFLDNKMNKAKSRWFKNLKRKQ
jgi:hypothetical protein